MIETEQITVSQFEDVFRELHSQLFYLAYDIVADRQMAQDIVSDVFLSVWNQHRNIGIDKLKGYLFVSVRNKAIDKVRHDQKWKTVPADELRNLMAVDSDWDVRERRIEEVENILKQMPIKTQTIFDLCYRKKKTYREAAEQLGLSAEAVKKQLSRALKQLRNKVKKE